MARSYEQMKTKVNYRKFSFHDDVLTAGIIILLHAHPPRTYLFESCLKL